MGLSNQQIATCCAYYCAAERPVSPDLHRSLYLPYHLVTTQANYRRKEFKQMTIFIIIKVSELITSAIKVFLVKDNLEVVKKTLAECNMLPFLLKEDSFAKLKDGTMLEPPFTFGILLNAESIFEAKDDMAVLAVDYASLVHRPEFQAHPCITQLKRMKESVRVINRRIAKLDLINPGRLLMAEKMENSEVYKQAAVDSALSAFEEIKSERPYYSEWGGSEYPQGTFYRMLFTKSEYEDIVKENHPYVRIL